MAEGAGGKRNLIRKSPLAVNKVTTGKGVSDAVSKIIKNPKVADRRASEYVPRASIDVDRQSSSRRIGRPSNVRNLRKSNIRASIDSRSVISNISAMLELDEYDFMEEEEFIDPTKIDAKLDVTALDRYNEDIRRIRRLMIEECRQLPEKGYPDDAILNRLTLIIRSLCRVAYYGTHKAQVLAEGAVVLIVWLLNRKNIKALVKTHIMQSLAEMTWTSMELKTILFNCRGIRVIGQLLVTGIKHRSGQAKWACYCLAMSCVSSALAIQALQEIDKIDEVIGEIAFYYYWTDWPANFGSILQGILFGPHSVIPMENTFDFI